MENLIYLREGYYAVLLPKDATGVIYVTPTDLEYTEKDRSINYVYDVPEGKIIGLLNEITEDQAREIAEDRSECYGTTINYLKYFFSLKGIKTENPLKKPELKYSFNAPEEHMDAIMEEYRIWQQYEKSLKKILIIKAEE